jgi:hypothetical protein
LNLIFYPLQTPSRAALLARLTQRSQPSPPAQQRLLLIDRVGHPHWTLRWNDVLSPSSALLAMPHARQILSDQPLLLGTSLYPNLGSFFSHKTYPNGTRPASVHSALPRLIPGMGRDPRFQDPPCRTKRPAATQLQPHDF